MMNTVGGTVYLKFIFHNDKKMQTRLYTQKSYRQFWKFD